MKPTLRDDFRHLLVKYIGERRDERELKKKLEEFFVKSLGVIGIFETGVKVENVEEENIIVRCKRGEEGKACAMFALANNWDGKAVRLQVKRVSGTIRAMCSKEGIKRRRRKGGGRRVRGKR
ncbi:MAG: Rpp14/Pop5 family protein [Candidatus Micrarchaeota archaeon]